MTYKEKLLEFMKWKNFQISNYLRKCNSKLEFYSYEDFRDFRKHWTEEQAKKVFKEIYEVISLLRNQKYFGLDSIINPYCILNSQEKNSCTRKCRYAKINGICNSNQKNKFSDIVNILTLHNYSCRKLFYTEDLENFFNNLNKK